MNKYSNIILIVIILIAIFLARQPFAQRVWPIFYSKLVNLYQSLLPRAFSLLERIKVLIQRYITTKITPELETRTEIVKEELGKETEKIGQTIWQQIKNFFLNQIQKILR